MITARMILVPSSIAALCLGASCDTDWRTTNAMAVARAGHTATLLKDGTVLVSGGYDDNSILSSVERFNPQNGTWSVVAPMHVPRARHTATRLLDGTVLVTGGVTEKKHPTPTANSAELFDPTANTWTEVAQMSSVRAFHAAVRLLDGTVLVVGGNPSDRGAERYDPASNSWTPAGVTQVPHVRGTATLLLDGTVVVAGGVDFGPERDDPSISLIGYSERYDPTSNSWRELALLHETPYGHAASRLADGTVLVSGGRNPGQTYKTAVRYDPTQTISASVQPNLWMYTADMSERRTNHQSTLLFDGNVLVTGGYLGCVDTTGGSCEKSLSSVELYRPNPNGRFLGTWEKLDAMFEARGDHTATYVPSLCRILVAGGFDWGTNAVLPTAETFPAPCSTQVVVRTYTH